MNLQAIIKGKKEWWAHVARVKALPHDYQVVYQQIQKYLFKVGPVELNNGVGVLSGIVELFEEGASLGKSVLDVTGRDVAAFCDELIKGSETYTDSSQDAVDQQVLKAMKKAADGMK